MTHDELLAKIDNLWIPDDRLEKNDEYLGVKALRAVVELHKPHILQTDLNDHKVVCNVCQFGRYLDEYPCTTIQAIEKALNGA